LTVIEEESDVGNLDDFIDELTPLELEAHKMNKCLRWLCNFVPPAYKNYFLTEQLSMMEF